jgi:hypothetical protein
MPLVLLFDSDAPGSCCDSHAGLINATWYPELGVPSRLLPSVSSLRLRPQCPTKMLPAVMLQSMRLSLETEKNRELI